MSLRSPDAVGELDGLRAWRVKDGYLWSLYRPQLWRPGEATRARCLTTDPDRPPRRSHRAPCPGCRCGLYAARRPPQAPDRYPNTCSDLTRLLKPLKAPSDDVLYGEVAGWGLAEVGDEAWRAEWCAVRAIYATSPLAGEVAWSYDVPLVALAA